MVSNILLNGYKTQEISAREWEKLKKSKSVLIRTEIWFS